MFLKTVSLPNLFQFGIEKNNKYATLDYNLVNIKLNGIENTIYSE